MLKVPSSRIYTAGLHTCRLLSTTAASTSTAVKFDIEPEFEKRGLPVKLKPEFYVPKIQRSPDRPTFNLESFKFGDERLKRSERTDPTRELNMTPSHWKNHKSPYRKWRHLWNTFSSSPAQRLAFPDLFISASISAAVTVYNEYFVVQADNIAGLDIGGFAGATTAIGILAGFRCKESYSRYDEARKFWGETINSTRDLARNTMMWMQDEHQRDRMLKLIQAFPVAYNFNVNRKGGHHNLHESDVGKPAYADRIQAEFQAELLDIYMDGKHDDDFRRLCEVKYKGGNGGVEVFILMGEAMASAVGTVSPILVRELDEQVQRLCFALGASERLLRTPLPVSFTRHTSRILGIWGMCLPFAMYPLMGILTLPACVLTSYAILAIEDIGVQLEEPFDVLPMRQYSDVIFDSVNQIKRNYKTVPVDVESLQA